MTGIESWSTTAASNNAATPNGWPEGQAPSTVNDCARQMMSSIRTWYQDAEWVPWGDTCTYVSSTSFKISGSDVTARYSVGRRVRAVGSSTGTIYGKIITTAFSTDTTVTLVWDSGSLSNETLTVSLATVKGATTARSVDLDAVTSYGSAIASASTVNLDNATGDYVHITGTTTITAITLASGRRRKVVFDGILTLTHNATSLILPGGANITTAAGDIAEFESEGSNNVRVLSYTVAANAPGGVPSSRNMTAAGLVTGGGTLAADRTFTVAAAVQSDMETNTSTTVAVVPGVLKYHPGAFKAWAYFTSSAGTYTLRSSYNYTSFSKTATGKIVITWSITLSGIYFGLFGTAGQGASRPCSVSQGADNTTTTSTVWIVDMANNFDDPTYLFVGIVGDI